MRSITLAAAVLTVLSAFAPAAAATPGDPAPPSLAVSGQGSVDRMPDRVTLALGIVTNDDNATRATSANNVIYNALVAKMSALGLKAGALRTTSYNVSFNPRPPRPDANFPQRYGYVVTREVSVGDDRTDRVGALIDAAVAAGAGNVNGVTFGLRDERGAYRAALAAAVADAQEQARALAAAAHLRLGRILEIAPAGGANPPPRPYPMARGMAAAVAVPTDVQPSDLTVRAGVSVTYALEP
ncbi:MAG: uncharacterized protein QOI11_1362 [Candidatus Eremiobacteraeota bacterium]|jgi:uncharacterized protein YggE|nr:uncharacterized protein [Candidatus Eremiobacteraeota bacterium]